MTTQKGSQITDPMSGLGFTPDTSAEARSPPGQWRLLAVALLGWALISWAILTPGRGGGIALLAVAAGSLMLAVWWFGRLGTTKSLRKTWPSAAVSMVVLLCGCFVLLGARVHVLETGRAAPFFQQAAVAGTPVTFEARLSGFPETKRTEFGDREWVRIVAFVPTSNDETARSLAGGAQAPLLLWLSDAEVDWRAARWGPGTRLRVTAKLTAEPAANVSAYTASPFALRQLHSDGLDTTLGSAAAAFRALLVEHASEVPEAELVPGFAVGDTSLVPEALGDLMLESSLSHLTAVSGSNTGLVIATMTWCVSRLGAGRRLRALAAGAALTAFVVVVGPDSSVLRAAVMAAVLLVSAFGGRRSTALPALGLAILALLAFDPWQALQAGFALSVAATLGILLFAAPTSHWLRRRFRLPRILALPFSVALAAQFSCGPLLLLLQPGVPAVGVLANIVAAPAAPLGTGLGLIAAILGPISPGAAMLAIRAASWPASWVAATAEICAALPAGRWNWPQGWPGAILLTVCHLALFVAWALATGRIGLPSGARVKLRQPWQPRSRTPLQIRVTIAVLTSVALTVFASVTLLYPLAKQLATPANWLLVACDVGQGDALLARDPDVPDEVILIDTGDEPEALERCLTDFGVRRISLLVLTHDDRDHVGAIASVLSRVDAALIAPTVVGEHTEQRAVVRALTEAGVPFQVGSAGSASGAGSAGGGAARDAENGAGLAWLTLAPPRDALLTETNAASLVLLLEVDGHRALLLADTGYEEQSALLRDVDASAWLAGIDVVKVAHHGSRDQEATLYERIGADWGLVSVGADNRYGHPNSETLGVLARAGTRALRTDSFGSVALVRQPDGTLAAWAERGQ